MNTHADKTHRNKNQSVANAVDKKKCDGKNTFQFVDNRPEDNVQRKLQEMVDNSPQVKQLESFQNLANKNQATSQVTQLQSISSNKPIQMYFGEDLIRKLKAKFKKKKQDGVDVVKGVYHGKGIQSRYKRLDAKTEIDHYYDIHDKEAEGKERVKNHPVAENIRKYAIKPATYVAKKGGDVLGNMVAGPIGGMVVKKVVGKGMDKANKFAKKKLNEGGNPYKVLREKNEELD